MELNLESQRDLLIRAKQFQVKQMQMEDEEEFVCGWSDNGDTYIRNEDAAHPTDQS